MTSFSQKYIIISVNLSPGCKRPRTSENQAKSKTINARNRLRLHSLLDYPGPRGFSRLFFAKEIKSKPRSGDNESRKRRGEREKPLVTLASNLTFMLTTGSGSDPRALIG